MEFWQKWFGRFVTTALIATGFVTKLYILAVIGVIWLIQEI